MSRRDRRLDRPQRQQDPDLVQQPTRQVAQDLRQGDTPRQHTTKTTAGADCQEFATQRRVDARHRQRQSSAQLLNH